MDDFQKRKEKILKKISGAFKNTLEADELKSKESTPTEAINFKDFYAKYKDGAYYLLLLPILYIAWFVRTRNLPLLQGKYLLGLDPYFFYRLSNELLTKGALPVIDTLRYSPDGFPNAMFTTYTYISVYFYKIIKLLAPNLSLIEFHIIYPPLITIFSLIFFFLFVKELFDSKTATISTLLLAVLPAYLFRTSAGFADHEAMAMFWIFLSFFLYTKMWKSNKIKSSALFGLSAGLSAAMASAAWGGYRFLIAPIGATVLILTFFENTKKSQMLGHSLFFGLFFILSPYLRYLKFDLNLLYPENLLLLLPIIIFLIQKTKHKVLPDKLTKPHIEKLFFISIAATFLVINQFTKTLNLENAWLMLFGQRTASRFGFTVSESLAAKILDGSGLWNSYSYIFIFAVLGSVLLFHLLTHKNKNSFKVLGSYTLLTLTYIIVQLRNYETQLFNIIYLGSLILFSVVIIYYYVYSQKDQITLKYSMLLPIAFFWLTMLMSIIQQRIQFVFAPAAAIMSAALITQLPKQIKLPEIKYKQIFSSILILLILILSFQNFNTTLNMNKNMGSSYPGQWESAMTFIREQTPEDAVIAHWWDYGHWTNTMGERASVTDGGNLKGWNHHSGRYLMTGNNITTTLEYLKTHKVTHILFSEEEIGKYHAFAYIGSDENLDRASTIGVFGLSDIKELRNGVRYSYNGNWPLDKDYIVGDFVFPKDSSSISKITYDLDSEGTILDSKATVNYNSEQVELDINCIYKNSTKITIDSEQGKTINGCVLVVPYFAKDNVVEDGAIFWASEKVKDGNFARLYLFSQEVPHFKLVYSDNTPLGVYEGHIIGPIKIWEVTYPEGVKEDPYYLQSSQYG